MILLSKLNYNDIIYVEDEGVLLVVKRVVHEMLDDFEIIRYLVFSSNNEMFFIDDRDIIEGKISQSKYRFFREEGIKNGTFI